MRILIMVVALVLFGVTGTSGQHVKDDPWNPEHINHLPAEVRLVLSLEGQFGSDFRCWHV